MKPNKRFLNNKPEFWAVVKLVSQKVSYSKKGLITAPNIDEIIAVFAQLNLYTNRIFFNNELTDLGRDITDYFEYRADLLNNTVRQNIMNVEDARSLYEQLKEQYNPCCPLPLNRKNKSGKNPAYLTCCVNILIEANLEKYPCKYYAGEITSFTLNKFPARSLSRRLDGSFPGVVNPIALWEIKEYYYTETFGSKVADAIYETMLDGYELQEIRHSLSRNILHYFITDSPAWWKDGKSYLCRIVDMIHMGLLTECIIGREVVTRIPEIMKEWKALYHQYEYLIDKSEK